MAKKKETRPEPDTSNHPYISNYPPLHEWLNKHEARCMWQTPRDPKPIHADCDWVPQAYIECWMLPGKRPLIITVYSNRMGWEIYTAADSGKVNETLADAERRLGLS